MNSILCLNIGESRCSDTKVWPGIGWKLFQENLRSLSEFGIARELRRAEGSQDVSCLAWWMVVTHKPQASVPHTEEFEFELKKNPWMQLKGSFSGKKSRLWLQIDIKFNIDFEAVSNSLLFGWKNIYFDDLFYW